jgi:hypothetical protein
VQISDNVGHQQGVDLCDLVRPKEVENGPGICIIHEDFIVGNAWSVYQNARILRHSGFSHVVTAKEFISIDLSQA